MHDNITSNKGRDVTKATHWTEHHSYTTDENKEGKSTQQQKIKLQLQLCS